jgi:hypothetical protein
MAIDAERFGGIVLSTVSYIVPLVPAGLFFGVLLLLLIVPVFAMAALAFAVLVGLAALLALAAATVAVPIVLLREAQHRLRRSPSLGAAGRALRHQPRIRVRRGAPHAAGDASLSRVRPLA